MLVIKMLCYKYRFVILSLSKDLFKCALKCFERLNMTASGLGSLYDTPLFCCSNLISHFEKQGSVPIGSESPVIRFTSPDRKIGIVFATTGFR
jgi:hypothetical protein